MYDIVMLIVNEVFFFFNIELIDNLVLIERKDYLFMECLYVYILYMYSKCLGYVIYFVLFEF